MNFQQLREKHRQFIYEGFEISKENGQLKIYFDFRIDSSPSAQSDREGDIKFRPEIIFPGGFQDISQDALKNLVFHLGLIEMISYWKATCSPEIIIKAGYLDNDQISWWKNLLIKGLGEFFYVNKIDFTKKDLVSFKVESRQQYPIFDGQLQDRNLILVGGGKDSAVTVETLDQTKAGSNSLLLNPTVAAKEVSSLAGFSEPITIQRIIDPRLLELNQQGYLNGHTPFSAYLAFSSTMAAVLYDFKNTIISNEASANEETINWMGQKINHQYSKTFEFEKSFNDYQHRYLSSSSSYFSFLRPLLEIQIAELFSKMEKYHQSFRSCSVGTKQGGIWCGKCSKCLFSYLMLFPFLGNQTKDIFGSDLFEDEDLIETMEALLQINGRVKPFDCVGTKDEVLVAVYLSIKKYQDAGLSIPKVLSAVDQVLQTQDLETLSNEVLNSWNGEHLLSPEYAGLLRSVIARSDNDEAIF